MKINIKLPKTVRSLKEQMANNMISTLALLVSILVFLFQLSAHGRQEETDKKISEIQTKEKNEQTFYEPLYSELDFSDKTKEIQVESGLDVKSVKIAPLQLRRLKGFEKSIRTFYFFEDSMTNEKNYLSIKHIKELQEEGGADTTYNEFPNYLMFNWQTEHFSLSISYIQITDFLNNKQLYMLVYIYDKEKEKVVENYLYDEYILLQREQETLFLPSDIFKESEQGEIIPVLKKGIQKMFTLSQELNTICKGAC